MPTNDSSHGGILLGCLILFLLGALCLIIFNINMHFVEYLNGFWIGETIDGPCIIYLDAGQMRLIESNEVLETSSMKKCSYTLSSKTMIGTSMRTYKFATDDLSSKSKIGRKLSQSNLHLDLYPIEGTCIIYDDVGDILTLMKDNKSNLELLI
jgi:hypothetical protein